MKNLNRQEKGQTMANLKTTNSAFSELLRNYENATRNRHINANTEKEYTDILEELARACTFSVLKKLCNAGGTIENENKKITDTAKTIRQLRHSLFKDLNEISRLEYINNNVSCLDYNDEGEVTPTIKDKDLYQALATLVTDTFGDGIDLMQTAIVTLLDETEKHKNNGVAFMEIPYSVRRLKRKVYIKDVDSLGGYEDTQTTPIQEVYKAIRRDVQNSRAVQVASRKYTYLDGMAIDTDTDTETVIYKRLPKYSGLAYEMADFSGKITGITADENTVDTVDNFVNALNLTAKQAKILELRLSGYGMRAIGTYLGITPQAVDNTLKRIQKKAIKIGLNPTR